MIEKNLKHIYFVGIGGIGMSGIADILLDSGYQVSGSDAIASANTERLEKKGATIYIGQKAENITKKYDVVVRSTAIKNENPELQQALSYQIPVIHRADMLAFLMKEKKAICVAGAHGKTTTSSMVALMLELAGKDPTIVVGGEISQIKSNAKFGTSDLLVAEADESDGSFLKLKPWMTVVTNIEADHLDYYKNLEEIKRVFQQFVLNVGSGGVGIFCIDCPVAKEMIAQAPGLVVTYGFSEEAQVRAESWQQEELFNCADIYYNNQRLGKLKLKVPGKHNISNALGAIAVGLTIGMSFEEIATGLFEFQGAKRRFQVVGEVNGIRVVDDYAHHPTEVKVTLEAAKGGHRGRVLAVFQPHRYSRTKFLAEEFAKSFECADEVILTEVYAAGERLENGAESDIILGYMHNQDKVRFMKRNEVNNYLLNHVRQGDLVLMMGAGNIWQTSIAFVEALENK